MSVSRSKQHSCPAMCSENCQTRKRSLCGVVLPAPPPPKKTPTFVAWTAVQSVQHSSVQYSFRASSAVWGGVPGESPPGHWGGGPGMTTMIPTCTPWSSSGFQPTCPSKSLKVLRIKSRICVFLDLPVGFGWSVTPVLA